MQIVIKYFQVWHPRPRDERR